MQLPRIIPPWDYGPGNARVESWMRPTQNYNTANPYIYYYLLDPYHAAAHYIEIDEASGYPTTVERHGIVRDWYRIDNPTGLSATPIDFNFRLAFLTPHDSPVFPMTTWDEELTIGSNHVMFINGADSEFFGNFRIEYNNGVITDYDWDDLLVREIALPGYDSDTTDNFRVWEGVLEAVEGGISSLRVFGHIAPGVPEDPEFDPYCKWFNSNLMRAIARDNGDHYRAGWKIPVAYTYIWTDDAPGLYPGYANIIVYPQAIREVATASRSDNVNHTQVITQ